MNKKEKVGKSTGILRSPDPMVFYIFYAAISTTLNIVLSIISGS